MCDHSLYSTQHRLAREGEDLALHRFESGAMGFASGMDLMEYEISKQKEISSFWGTIRDWLLLPSRTIRIPAICVPPGTTLLLTDIPRPTQESLYIDESEIVVFTELHSPSYSFRDALLLPNTTRVLLQDLPEGIHALVLNVSPEALMETTAAGARAA
jgi:hypothetical protein